MSMLFPTTPEFVGLYEPSRVEADVVDLEVEGSLPESIKGVFYQVAPDPQYPPMLGADIFFNGDGAVSAFRFSDGKVSLKRRYVQTERLLAQRREHRSLTGVYRNVFTNDPLAARNNSTANTTVVKHNGVLLALKEDNLPYAMDPDTLETIGVWDFGGQVRSATFTAHPKVDPETGDLLCFAYEAKGEGTPDIAYYEIAASGEVKREVWFKAPYAAMIHDFAVTENYVVFPVIPLTVDLERMKRGGQHFQWQPDLPQLFGVLPRRGNERDVRWYYGPANGFQGHTLNSFEEGSRVFVDMPVADGNAFYFFPQEDGSFPPLETLKVSLMRWTFDLESEIDDVEPEALTDFPCEFPRCDPRYMGKTYRHGFVLKFDPSLPYDGKSLGAPPFQFFNTLARVDVVSGDTEAWFAGDAECFQEPIFVPRSPDAPEGDGFVMSVLNHLRSKTTELVVLDAMKLSSGPVARIKIPFRLRMSLHGTWSPL
ncbi:TPA: carotenoid oxygenase family protein [Burkholderia cenocepacia]|uniref:Carotenoid oxygenase family protein n=1 Tax=Burkholderia latens TaxID=488446 RepID=A0A6H9SX72_9BURK|nr:MULTISPECIES: carotenoid oxygenase family protein [Burkholderia]KAB0644476.1 carotenoid oxygenase family protein [Burkholderia latens]MBJ9922857.1 carotenoid oxygenase family protein [Burkholderia cenocepacia]UJH78807.1 carotenoid oxygenase family protein [Burkholderia cenocepacia]VWB23123.1 putative dioxygenase [Burkholderia latens]HDR9879868.1 carotenoid oxygenase family protein [Burkholderia cenocepacia]